MRRVRYSGIALALVSAMVLAGCQTPPPGYRPPTIESVQVSPQPAHPGDTVSLLIEARDDQAVVSGVPQLLITPTGTRLDANGCTSEQAPLDGVIHVLITITCPVPAFASNGTWHLQIRVNDGAPLDNYPGLTRQIPFEVAGGSHDRTPPQLVSSTIAPATVDQETTFTLTMRLHDESLPLSVGQPGSSTFFFTKPFAPNSAFICNNASYTPVSSTDVDVVVTCTPTNYNVAGRSEPGLHVAHMAARDALAQEGTIEMSVDVQPTPGT